MDAQGHERISDIRAFAFGSFAGGFLRVWVTQVWPARRDRSVPVSYVVITVSVRTRPADAQRTWRSTSRADLPFGTFLEHWLEAILPALRISEHTKADYARHAKALAPLAATPLGALGVADAEALLGGLASQGYSKTTCRLVRATLSRVLGDAERLDLVARNVARASRLPAGARAPKERRVLLPEEAARLEAALEDERDEALWLSMLLLGLRPGEAAALASDGRSLRGCLARGSSQTLDAGGLRGRPHQDPPLGPCAQDAAEAPGRVRKARARASSGRRRGVRQPLGSVARSVEHGAPAPRAVRQGRRPECHPLRAARQRGRLLSDAGVPIETLADLLGHTSTQMLEQVYRHRVRKVVDVGIW